MKKIVSIVFLITSLLQAMDQSNNSVKKVSPLPQDIQIKKSQANFALGLNYYLKNDLDKAYKYFLGALTSSADATLQAQSLLEIGQIFRIQNKIKAAEHVTDDALILNPQDAPTLGLAYCCQAFFKENEEQKKLCNKALSLLESKQTGCIASCHYLLGMQDKKNNKILALDEFAKTLDVVDDPVFYPWAEKGLKELDNYPWDKDTTSIPDTTLAVNLPLIKH